MLFVFFFSTFDFILWLVHLIISEICVEAKVARMVSRSYSFIRVNNFCSSCALNLNECPLKWTIPGLIFYVTIKFNFWSTEVQTYDSTNTDDNISHVICFLQSVKVYCVCVIIHWRLPPLFQLRVCLKDLIWAILWHKCLWNYLKELIKIAYEL